MHEDTEAVVIISFRGKKFEIPLEHETKPIDIKTKIATETLDEIQMMPEDIKLIHKGKVLKDEEYTNPGDLFFTLCKNYTKAKSNKIIIRLIASGASASEVRSVETTRLNAPRVRDDLTAKGAREIEGRQRLGRKMLYNAAKKDGKSTKPTYGFKRIETLPMLPDQQKAKEILTSLANDPGVLACMTKHKWNVGCLAELYPEGKVGKSPVCVMGLNENKGARILLRLRTDDLTGFRKILNIRKVLFHELAHNVHSEHNGEFFQLMRQIEKECNEMDWTGGAGLSQISIDNDLAYEGGTFCLGGEREAISSQMSFRELAARAAETRMTKEEEEIQNACGCGKIDHRNTDPSNINKE